jgi:hypothetical protein
MSLVSGLNRVLRNASSRRPGLSASIQAGATSGDMVNAQQLCLIRLFGMPVFLFSWRERWKLPRREQPLRYGEWLKEWNRRRFRVRPASVRAGEQGPMPRGLHFRP